MLNAGILWANTRLHWSDNLPREIKFPFILPKKHPITQLIVKYHQKLDCHEMDVNYTLNHLCEKYHVIHSRQEVKRCIQNCHSGRDASRYIQLNSRWLCYHRFAWRGLTDLSRIVLQTSVGHTWRSKDGDECEQRDTCACLFTSKGIAVIWKLPQPLTWQVP